MKIGSKYIFRILILIFLFGVNFSGVFARQQPENALIDSIKNRFIKQSAVFPQEKIYVQTDKYYYVTGETVRLRAHLTDAMSHIPDSTSRYIYAELINPHDSIICRVKIRPENNAYSGYITLPETIAEGEYTLRCYTRYMENLPEDYFFKRKIKIGTPLSALYRTETTFRYAKNDKKKIEANLKFIDLKTKETIVPENIIAKYRNSFSRKVKINNDYAGNISFPVSADNIILLEYTYKGKFHKQFIPVFTEDNDFVVDFFPEGGNPVDQTPNKIAFKALNNYGKGENITGIVVNRSGDTLCVFKSDHLGMGYFILGTTPEEDISVVCTNDKNSEKTFSLPFSGYNKAGLQTAWKDNKLFIHVRKSPVLSPNDSLYLIVHCRGTLLSALKWDNEEDFMFIEQEKMPAGVIHLLLADSDLNPVSERLVFNMNRQNIADYKFSTNKTSYNRRDLVKAELNLTDHENNPLFANLSVAVTDDKDIRPDSCVNILTSMLLTSDLRGYIESPTYYFREENTEAERNLDILMMTQGWRRYDIKKTIKGDIEKPSGEIETSQRITGTVKGGLFMNKASAGFPITIISTDLRLMGETSTDKNGRFVFKNFELPDSTQYIVQGRTKKGGKRVELILDEESFPKVQAGLPQSGIVNQDMFEDYIEKADMKFTLENGVRMIYLKEVEVNAKRIRKEKSIYSSPFNTIITSDKIKEQNASDIYQLLRGIPGLKITENKISIRNSNAQPLILIDNIIVEQWELTGFPVQEIQEIEVAKDAAGMSIFGVRGAGGAIMITTQSGEAVPDKNYQFNVKKTIPSGYQIRKEFYSPKYETREQIDNPEPDLRSTIYWNPNIITDKSGKTSIEFYTADSQSTYSVIIEGITYNGKLVHIIEKISRQD